MSAASVSLPERYVCVGRVLYEDQTFIALEIAKPETTEVIHNKSDRYHRLVFVTAVPPSDPSIASAYEITLPWEEAS